MVRVDNYAIQAGQAKERFLSYDQQKLIQKLKLEADDKYLYTKLLGCRYRISRFTGDMDRQEGGYWVDANTFAEVMTLLDLVCDSREDRFIRGKWKNMASFGLLFHQQLLEDKHDPWADRFEQDMEGFRRACLSMGGRELPIGDAAYAIELFDGLCIVLQLWLGDEEFPANLRFLWDENALMYIRYETMYFIRGFLLERIREKME